MFSRTYFALDMLETAALEDEKQTQKQFQSEMRKIVGNPLDNISNTKFIKLYRLPNKRSVYKIM